MNALDRKRSGGLDEARPLLKAAVNSDLGLALVDCVGVRVGCPSKRGTRAESLVAPCQSSVDDVLAITTDGNKSAYQPKRLRYGLPSVWTVLEALRVDFGCPQVTKRNVEPLSIFDGLSYVVSISTGEM